MENNPVLLKSSMFGGFKKKDVLSYIFELNETTQEEKQRLAEQLEELVQSRDGLAARALDMEQKLTSLQSSLDETLARLDEANEKNVRSLELIERLKAEAVKNADTISQQNTEIARQTELNAQVSEKNRAYEEKRHQVELAASQIAELLGQAQDDAAKAVERAKLEADEIVENAKASLEVHIEEANKSVDGAYKKFSEFKSRIENKYTAVLEATSSINEEMSALKDSIEDIERLVPKKLSAEDLPTLQYKNEDDSSESEEDNPALTAAAISTSIEEEASSMAKDILRRYGVRKDDSGFFRLASDQ